MPVVLAQPPRRPFFLALLPVSIGVLLLIAIATLFLTYGPVLAVETKYQAQRGLTALFGTHDLRAIFSPDFRALLDNRGYSRHQDYGISIPAIHLDEPVVFNVDPNDKTAYTAALKKGIAHASGTAFPDNSGLGYYFAHSSSPDLRQQYNAVFYLLGKLETGDEVFIWHEGQRFEYVVKNRQVTKPSDVSFLYDGEYPNETIVLQTCWPPGTTNERLLIFAERVAE